MTPSHTIKDNTVAVSDDVKWRKITADTPRGVKVWAIARHVAGIAQQAELKTNEDWYTHWFPIPTFED